MKCQIFALAALAPILVSWQLDFLTVLYSPHVNKQKIPILVRLKI
jgi:hypothetical protein